MSELNDIAFPELSDQTIESKAQRLIGDFGAEIGMEVGVPMPVEVIAEQYLNYQIDFVDSGLFSDPDYLGGIVFDDRMIQISSRIEAHEGRYNFTVAHEIGHHVLHREFYLDHRDATTNKIVCREVGEKPLVEQQADRFAAALLMPASLVRSAFGKVARNINVPPERSPQAARAMAASVVAEGGFSNVSNTAMVNRLIDLSLLRGARYQSGTSLDFHRRRSRRAWMLRNAVRRTAQTLVRRFKRNR